MSLASLLLHPFASVVRGSLFSSSSSFTLCRRTMATDKDKRDAERLVWVDCEMTGLERTDTLLEVSVLMKTLRLLRSFKTLMHDKILSLFQK
jgi:hypothetical protein